MRTYRSTKIKEYPGNPYCSCGGLADKPTKTIYYTMQIKNKFLNTIGVYGFDEVEPLILAALISEDPILLIGKAGTGKTFLLNSISETLGLENRHYNASLISFDDLIGFPVPDEEGKKVIFLPTPATIWGTETVLIDELSRCKPETQNKFFSIIHEKKIQGIPLEKLCYRWAAMNPFSFESGEGDDHYEGSQPLDQALADRFAFIIEVPDWLQLTKKEQESVIYPAGENTISNDNGTLRQFIAKLKPVFNACITHPYPEVVSYCRLATSLLTEAGLRISPRRARLLARNITALLCVANANDIKLNENNRKSLYKLVLNWSLPHRAYKDHVPQHLIDSAHSEAVRLTFESNPDEKWISEFLWKNKLKDKLKMLFQDPVETDVRSLAVIQLLARESKSRAAIFSFCLFPLLSECDLVNEEAYNELSKIAKKILYVDGKMEWRENNQSWHSIHPSWSNCLQYLSRFSKNDDKRIQRAKQLFLYLITENILIPEPEIIEEEFNQCFTQAKNYVLNSSKK